MLETFFHRAIAPYAYQVNNQKVEVYFEVGKKWVKEAKLVFGDPFHSKKDGIWVKKEVSMKKVAECQNREVWIGQMENHTKRFRYAFKIRDKNNKEYLIGEIGSIPKNEKINKEGNGFTFSYWNVAQFMNSPKWFKKTSWYQIFPDRFARKGDEKNNKKFVPWSMSKPLAHELYGGNIEGVISKLKYIRKLGFNGIYLTPIFESCTSHRYDTKNYNKIDPVLGNEKTFKKLIKEAHKLGIKVMLDAVYNHIGYSSRIWQDVLKNKENSKYSSWFWINNWNDLKTLEQYSKENYNFSNKYPYETFAFASIMPRLNWNNSVVRKYLIKSALKWTKMGIDAWRLDVSFEPSNKFWREFNNAIKNFNSNIAIIGEVWWDSINYFDGSMWDGVMNYPLRKIIIDYFSGKGTLDEKKYFVERFNEISLQYAPEVQWSILNLLSSHDTTRLITLLKNDSQKFQNAFKLLFFQPGAPSTYYGEEIGLQGGNDPDNRRPMPWKNANKNFATFFKKLNLQREKFVNTSNIFERYLAKLNKEIIEIKTSKFKLIIKDFEVKVKFWEN